MFIASYYTSSFKLLHYKLMSFIFTIDSFKIRKIRKLLVPLHTKNRILHPIKVIKRGYSNFGGIGYVTKIELERNVYTGCVHSFS